MYKISKTEPSQEIEDLL